MSACTFEYILRVCLCILKFWIYLPNGHYDEWQNYANWQSLYMWRDDKREN